MVTMETADNAWKSFYFGAVSDMLNTSVNPLLAQIKQSTADVWGKDVRRLVRYGVNGGGGAGTEEGNLPAAGGNHYAQFVTTLKNLFGTIEISDKAIRSSANNEGAFVNLLNDEMDGLIKSSSFNFGRMLFGDGSGTLATVASVNSGVFTVDSVKNIAEGMIVDFVAAAGNVIATGRTVVKVDRINKTVTVSGATLTASEVPAASRIVMQNSNGLELTGLGALFSDSATLYGVDRSQHDWMNPYKDTAVGEISETKIQKAIDYLEEVSGSKVNFIVCSWGVKRALAEYFSTYKRFVDTVELNGGYKAMSFNGIPVVADRFCPEGTMYLLNTDDFCLHQLCDWQWLEGEDGKVLKQIAGKPVYTATLVKYADLVCTRPCGQAMLSGITEA
ncbi:MAG: phage major capsid protein [Clostridia bacterium]|nr:phage major capsid protein [Clostridia bacterium]